MVRFWCCEATGYWIALLSTKVLDCPSPVLFFEFLLLMLVFLMAVDEVAAYHKFETAEDDHDVRTSECVG